MDRRIKYTKRVLNESLFYFLGKKEITKITVTEICNHADINRSTYYTYYTDPYDQLAIFKSELLKDMMDYTVQIDTEHLSPEETRYKILLTIIEYIATKREEFRILMGKSGDHKLQEEILAILGEKAFLAGIPRDVSEEEKRFLLRYAANGCFGIFYHWLMKDDCDVETVARVMADFTAKLLRK